MTTDNYRENQPWTLSALVRATYLPVSREEHQHGIPDLWPLAGYKFFLTEDELIATLGPT